MQTNIQIIERSLRVLIGAGLLAFAISDTENLWMYLGFLPFATGLVGWCPYYELINSSKRYKVVKKKSW